MATLCVLCVSAGKGLAIVRHIFIGWIDRSIRID